MPGKEILRDAVLVVDGDDLSEFVSEVSLETERDEVEVTAMGATNKEYLPGLGDATITVTFFNSSEVQSVLWALSQSETPFEVTLKKSSAATSSTNPVFSMDANMYGYSPISGGVGEASTSEVTFRNASQEGVVRSFT